MAQHNEFGQISEDLATAYVRYHRIDLPTRFDIIGITGEPGTKA